MPWLYSAPDTRLSSQVILITLEGKEFYVLYSSSMKPMNNSVFVPVIEVPVTLMRGSEVLDRTFSMPPDGQL